MKLIETYVGLEETSTIVYFYASFLKLSFFIFFKVSQYLISPVRKRAIWGDT